jgi:dienelactone hydrolase
MREPSARSAGFALAAILLLPVLAAATGCGGGSGADAAGQSASTPPAPTWTSLPAKPIGTFCLTAAERRHTLRFASKSGGEVTGVVLGTGRAGLVLVHQSAGDLCQWVPYGRRLAGLGYRVLAIDLNGNGSARGGAGQPMHPRWDLDVAAATEQLRSRGVTKVVLMGASMGGSTVVTAAAEITPTVAGVISLSGPANYGDMDGMAAAAKLAAPLLVVVASSDPEAGDLHPLVNAARVQDRHLELVPGAVHGVALLSEDYEPNAKHLRGVVEGFIRTHTAGA